MTRAGAMAIATACALILLISAAVRGGPPDLRTPSDDARVGREVAKQAAAEFGLIEDPKLNAYVEAIGRRLARHAPGYGFDYRFAIVDDTAPNAFALPGGYIFVSRGLLALSNSGDELAGVLGHEIAHVAMRHAAAREGLGSPSFLTPMKTLQIYSFSRDLEHTADRVGQGLTGVAGYDPGGITEFLESLNSLEQLRLGYSRLPSFLSTHPGTINRVADTAQRASEIAWQRKPGFSGGREGHLRKLEGLVIGPTGHQGVFRGARFLHPDMGFTIRFPKGWNYHNTSRAVGAVSPRRNGQVFLEHSGPGKDPGKAADAWIEKGKPCPSPSTDSSCVTPVITTPIPPAAEFGSMIPAILTCRMLWSACPSTPGVATAMSQLGGSAIDIGRMKTTDGSEERGFSRSSSVTISSNARSSLAGPTNGSRKLGVGELLSSSVTKPPAVCVQLQVSMSPPSGSLLPVPSSVTRLPASLV